MGYRGQKTRSKHIQLCTTQVDNDDYFVATNELERAGGASFRANKETPPISSISKKNRVRINAVSSSDFSDLPLMTSRNVAYRNQCLGQS